MGPYSVRAEGQPAGAGGRRHQEDLIGAQVQLGQAAGGEVHLRILGHVAAGDNSCRPTQTHTALLRAVAHVDDIISDPHRCTVSEAHRKSDPHVF